MKCGNHSDFKLLLKRQSFVNGKIAHSIKYLHAFRTPNRLLNLALSALTFHLNKITFLSDKQTLNSKAIAFW